MKVVRKLLCTLQRTEGWWMLQEGGPGDWIACTPALQQDEKQLQPVVWSLGVDSVVRHLQGV